MRSLLALEALVFGFAVSVHSGWSVSGFEHGRAAIAESVIGLVLLVGLLLTLVLPSRERLIGLGAQLFALLGTLAGVTMVAIGIGPQTLPDVVYHAFLLMLLLTGIFFVWKGELGRANAAR